MGWTVALALVPAAVLVALFLAGVGARFLASSPRNCNPSQSPASLRRWNRPSAEAGFRRCRARSRRLLLS